MSTASNLATQRSRLAKYLAAEDRILKNQSWSENGVNYSRANLQDVRQEIARIRKEINRLEAGGAMRVRRVIPRDN